MSPMTYLIIIATRVQPWTDTAKPVAIGRFMRTHLDSHIRGLRKRVGNLSRTVHRDGRGGRIYRFQPAVLLRS
jgi:hypothetical protein